MAYSFSQENQSPWIIDIYNKYLPFKTDGFLVEIGVGHTIAGMDQGLDLQNLDSIVPLGSNTMDLLNLGWGGIYIEPVSEFCEEASILHKDNLERLIIVNSGASDKDEILKMFHGETFIQNDVSDPMISYIGREIECRRTSDILSENNCPEIFDVLSIDVYGW